MMIQALANLIVLAAAADPTVLVVRGAAGTPEYGRQFESWAADWERAAKLGSARFQSIASREELQKQLAGDAEEPTAPLWIVMIGHGTFDGKQAKFNLSGPDVSAVELSEWLQPLRRPLVILCCFSSSAPFINRLSAPGRVVVTATKSGHEQNFSRFGGFLSRAVVDQQADLDKDHQTSVLEAFLIASRQLEDWYAQDARLATEHALIDDNGDGSGTPASWFRGHRAVRQAKGAGMVDGQLARRVHLIESPDEQSLSAELRQRRDALEMQLEKLRVQKQELAEDDYYEKIQEVLVQLARLYEDENAE